MATIKIHSTPSYATKTTFIRYDQFIIFFLGFSIGLIISFNHIQSFFTTKITPSISTPILAFPPPPPPKPDSPKLVEVAVEEIYHTTMIHNMSDKELMLRASKVEGNINVNSNNAPKVAFMFMVKGPIPLAQLWEKFFEGHNGYYSIYVHAHPSYNKSFSKDSVFYGRNIPSKNVIWGTMSMVDAEKRLLGNALLDSSNRRFVLVSESCIPLFNFTTIYNYLVRTNRSFLDCFDSQGRNGRRRYNKTMSPDILISQWRKGSQWFEVHRDLAVKIILEHKYYSLFNKHCVKYCISDEHYLPTMVNILYPEMIQNRSLTWSDWSYGGAHPSRHGWADLNVAFLTRAKFGSKCTYNGEVTNICYLFARKFSPSALEPLLRIAPSILGFGS